MPTLDHPELTTMGLLLEAHAGAVRHLSRHLEHDSGLSVPWFEVLLRLARTPGHRLRMSDLAAQSTLTASGLTRVVDRLVDEGLVARETCPSDRRGAYAVLTDAGRASIEAAAPVHVGRVQDLLADALDDREVAQLTALLRKLRDALNPAAAAASACPPEEEAEAPAPPPSGKPATPSRRPGGEVHEGTILRRRR